MQFVLHIFLATTLLLSTCNVSTPVVEEADVAEIVGISDGDTVTAFFPAKRIQRKIRLATIDAPEFDQPFGRKARKSLSDLVFRKKVRVVSQGEDRYGRIIGELILDDSNINVEQLRRGYAWHYKFHAKDQRFEKRQVYAEAEKSAREKRLGLWSYEKPVPPWVFRKRGGNSRRNNRTSK